MRTGLTRSIVMVTALLLATAVGCGGSKRPASQPELSDPDPATLAAPEWATGPAPAVELPSAVPSPVAPVEARPAVPQHEARWQVRQLGAAAEAPPERPRRVGKQDIWFNRARLDNAFRLLSDAGRFNLVLQGDLSQEVTAELRDVEPYDALLALAEAHGVSVRFRRNIVIVSGP